MDTLLFTPGPLTTSRAVKEAMLIDVGSRDETFIRIVREIRDEVLRVAGAPPDRFTTIPMQGSGTFGLEAVISSVMPREGKLLVPANGAYGARLGRIARAAGIETELLNTPEDRRVDPTRVEAALARDGRITHVAMVHCETSTGMLNPIDEVGGVVGRAARAYIVDAMSSFGAVPIHLEQAGIDYLVSSSNKCIEGVPGFSFIIARSEALAATEGFARSLSLDLLAQVKQLDQSGQFRFTPPTHAILAFRQALRELEAEGGVDGRAARYRSNHATLRLGMANLGFESFLPEADQGYIITAYRTPRDPAFDFDEFYRRLSGRGFVIYPGSLSAADCFRIGTIGRLFPKDIEHLLEAIAATLADMGVVPS